LGSGPLGSQNIKSHIVFSNIDWKLLERKQTLSIYDSSLMSIRSINFNKTTSNLYQSIRNIFSSKSIPNQDLKSCTYAVGGKKKNLLSRTWNNINSSRSNSHSGKNISDIEFNLDFEKLLLVLGKESWIPSWQQIGHGHMGPSSYSYKSELLRDWDYESLDFKLQEIGLSQLI